MFSCAASSNVDCKDTTIENLLLLPITTNVPFEVMDIDKIDLKLNSNQNKLQDFVTMIKSFQG
jgi:hypothetical protein